MAKPNAHDIGAAMILWYAEAVKEHPEGLVTQAQAAIMLGISRMAVSRLVARGYLRAVYFPKPPNVAGLVVTDDYPAYVRLMERLDIAVGQKAPYEFPKACFVSFADVVKLWRSGEVQKRCAIKWDGLFDALFARPAILRQKMEAKANENKRQADAWHEKNGD